MYPIAWFPMIDPNETYSSDYIKTNKGLETIYRSSIVFNGTNTIKHFFGQIPVFTNDTVFSFAISSSLGERIQKGFGITATIYMRETCTIDGTLFKFYNSNRTIEIGYRSGGFYIKNGSNLNSPEIHIDDIVSINQTYAFAIVFTGLELRVYMNKVCVYTNTCYYPSSNIENTFMAGAGASPFTIMNIKIYDSELSMKQLLEDYAFLYGHYKFDGGSSDDTSFNTEYDCSGVGVDVVDNDNFSLSSTYSPIRQYSAVTGGNGFTVPAGPQFYICAWANVMTMMSTIFGVKISDQNVISISRNGNNVGVTTNGDCTTSDAFPSIPYPDSVWMFVELSLYWKTLSTRVFKVRITKFGGESVETEYTFNSVYMGDMVIAVGGGIAISDLRVYMNPITETEVSYLINRNVHIDDKGTLYATELQELNHMSTFGFGDRGQIMAPEFTDTLNSDEKGVMQYDYLNGIMNVNNFKEI